MADQCKDGTTPLKSISEAPLEDEESNSRKKYSCNICTSKNFTSRFSLSRHYKTFHTAHAHKCDICINKMFSNRSSLNRHCKAFHA